MTNIIDSLVVEFGLDPQGKFKKSAEEIETSLKKTKESTKKAADSIDHSMKEVGESLRKVRDDLIGLFVAFTAGRGIKEFVQDITSTDAGLGRLSKQLGVSVETIAAWGGAATRFGGSVEATAGTMRGLTDQFEQFQLTGQSAIVPYLYALQVGFHRTASGALDLNRLLFDLSDATERIHDNARSTTLLRSMGIDEGTINVILQGHAAVQKLLDDQKKLGTTTKASAEAAQKLTTAWLDFEQSAVTIGRNLLTTLGPALIGILHGLKSVAEFAQAHMPVVEGIFAALTGAVIALSTAITVNLVGGAIESAVAVLGGPLLIGIGLVSAAIYELWKHWDEFGKYVTGFWDGLVSRATAAANAIKGLFGTTITIPRPSGTKPTTPPSKSTGKSATATSGQTDVDKFINMGWTKAQAQGIVANLKRESGGVANKVGDNGAAYGVAQWHADRQAAFAKWAGHDIRQSTRDEQLAFVNYELRSGSDVGARRAGTALGSAKDASSAAEIFSRMFERPAAADKEAAIRASMAAGASGGGAVYGDSNTTNNVSIGSITVQTKATDAEGIAKDLGPAIKRSSLAQNSNYGAN